MPSDRGFNHAARRTSTLAPRPATPNTRHERTSLRRYPAHLVAEVEVESSFTGAGNQALGVLVAFISGSTWPVGVAAVLDAQNDDLAWVLVDPVEHPVGPSPRRVDTCQIAA